MAEALILDAEAVKALAFKAERRVLAQRATAILRLAHEKRALVRVPAPVLAEVCRGVKYDAAINQLLSNPGVQVFDLTRPIAQRAGHLLARLKLLQRTLSTRSSSRAQHSSTRLLSRPATRMTCAASPLPFSKIGIFAL